MVISFIDGLADAGIEYLPTSAVFAVAVSCI